MRYYLTRATFGATDLEIDENEYEDYKESSKVLSSCLSLEKSYEILISNYIDLENEQIAWATLGMVRNVSDDDFFNATLLLDRRMANFLTTARLHIDHLQKRGGDCMKGQSIEEVKDIIKSFCATEEPINQSINSCGISEMRYSTRTWQLIGSVSLHVG